MCYQNRFHQVPARSLEVNISPLTSSILWLTSKKMPPNRISVHAAQLLKNISHKPIKQIITPDHNFIPWKIHLHPFYLLVVVDFCKNLAETMASHRFWWCRARKSAISGPKNIPSQYRIRSGWRWRSCLIKTPTSSAASRQRLWWVELAHSSCQ